VDYTRPQADTLRDRLTEPRRFSQVVAGPRQVGTTTLVRQVTDELDVPVWSTSADEPTLRGRGWIAEEWEYARIEAGDAPGVLVIDEVQKAEGWAESVKRLWDEDTDAGRALHVGVSSSRRWARTSRTPPRRARSTSTTGATAVTRSTSSSPRGPDSSGSK